MATQTIVTSHSPTVADIPEPHEIALVVNTNGNLSARPFLTTPIPPDATNPIRGLFLTDRDATTSALMHPRILIPEGKTDANWLRLLVKWSEINAAARDDGVMNFSHEVGVIPTKDARIGEVYQALSSIHPNIICLVDGDAAGIAYVAILCRGQNPPNTLIQWPQRWSIEHVVGWIVAADLGILNNAELVAAGVPQTRQPLEIALSDANALKTNEIVHGLLAEAVAASPGCRRRVSHIFRFLTDVATSRSLSPGTANASAHANGITTIWTFNDAFPGI